VKRREDGTDTSTIATPNGGTFAPVEGIGCDRGGDPADALEVPGTDLTSTVDATSDAGTLTYTREAATQTIAFARIAPIADAVAGGNSIIPGTAGADAITVTCFAL
jgi:hypothetical protein